jgi:hypothetical protein
MKTNIRSFAASALALGSLITIHSTCVAADEARPAEIIHQYALAPFSLSYFGYTAEELAAAQPNESSKVWTIRLSTPLR